MSLKEPESPTVPSSSNVTTASGSPSMFLSKFPREIRDMIYEEVLVQVEPILIRYVSLYELKRYSVARTTFNLGQNRLLLTYTKFQRRLPLCILLVNRQIRAEVSKIFYSKNAFRVEWDLVSANAFIAFLEDRPSHSLQKIQSLGVFINMTRPMVRVAPTTLRWCPDYLRRCSDEMRTCSHKMTRIIQTSLHLRELDLIMHFDIESKGFAHNLTVSEIFAQQGEELGAKWLTTIHGLKRLSLTVEVPVFYETIWPYQHDHHMPRAIELLRSRMLINGAALGQNHIAVSLRVDKDMYPSNPMIQFKSDDNEKGESKLPQGSLPLERHRELCQKSGGRLDYLV